MTREIIENILKIENEAEDIVLKAKKKSHKLNLDTEQIIYSLKSEFKEKLKILEQEKKNEIAEKCLLEKEKIDLKTQTKLDSLEKIAESNLKKIIKKLAQVIL